MGKRFNDVSVLVDEIDMFVGLGAWYEAEYRFKTVDALSGKKSKDQGMINLLLASDRVQELRRKVIEALNKENLPHR